MQLTKSIPPMTETFFINRGERREKHTISRKQREEISLPLEWKEERKPNSLGGRGDTEGVPVCGFGFHLGGGRWLPPAHT